MKIRKDSWVSGAFVIESDPLNYNQRYGFTIGSRGTLISWNGLFPEYRRDLFDKVGKEYAPTDKLQKLIANAKGI